MSAIVDSRGCASITDSDESGYCCCGVKRPKTGTQAREEKKGEEKFNPIGQKVLK
jgi:hypothetical protein